MNPARPDPLARPALVAATGECASLRFLEFFAANIRNPHTRRAFVRAAEEFLAWCADGGVPSIAAVKPAHVATWIEAGSRELAAPSVKQRLAAIRHLFDWLVTGQVVPVNRDDHREPDHGGEQNESRHAQSRYPIPNIGLPHGTASVA